MVGKLRECAGLLAVLSLGKKVARVRVGDEGESSSRKPEVAEMRVPSQAPSPACNLRHALANLKRSAVSDVLEGAITRQYRQVRVVINRTNSPTYATSFIVVLKDGAAAVSGGPREAVQLHVCISYAGLCYIKGSSLPPAIEDIEAGQQGRLCLTIASSPVTSAVQPTDN